MLPQTQANPEATNKNVIFSNLSMLNVVRFLGDLKFLEKMNLQSEHFIASLLVTDNEFSTE
jgi:hypothetical protein